MSWLGIDVGGANLKSADGEGFAATQVFELWKAPLKLTQRLRQLIAEAPGSDHVVATMTGELADCFCSKAEGVRHIVDCLEQAAAGRHLRIYSTMGTFVTPQVAVASPQRIAAANWHALARFAQRYCINGEASIMVDVGSTTTDIVPCLEDPTNLCGQTDTDRLRTGSLIYTGVVRTPVCAVVNKLPYRGQRLRVAQELFATMQDVYLLRGYLSPDPSDHGTADGRAATKAAARLRLGRMICADQTEFHHRDAAAVAMAAAKAQARLVARGIAQMWKRLGVPSRINLIISGKGEFLARGAAAIIRATSAAETESRLPIAMEDQFVTEQTKRPLARPRPEVDEPPRGSAPLPTVPIGQLTCLSAILGPTVSKAATAHALAVLARERRTWSRPESS